MAVPIEAMTNLKITASERAAFLCAFPNWQGSPDSRSATLLSKYCL